MVAHANPATMAPSPLLAPHHSTQVHVHVLSLVLSLVTNPPILCVLTATRTLQQRMVADTPPRYSGYSGNDLLHGLFLSRIVSNTMARCTSTGTRMELISMLTLKRCVDAVSEKGFCALQS